MEKTPNIPKFKTVEEELAFLREQISKTEKHLIESRADYNIDDLVKNQIKHYSSTLDQEVLDDTLALAKSDLESIVLNLEPETHDGKISELLDILKEKGIRNAISVLSSLNNPHLEDDFHRFLVQYLKHGYEAKGVSVSADEFKGLDMTLYEVVLPEVPEDEKGKPLKELISSMEQFLSGMLSITDNNGSVDYKKNYLVLEIANANGSDQFVFYVAVPNTYKQLFEKQILSVFHNAVLIEANSDYNIFNMDGVSVGSYLESTNNPIYQFKTYEKFDHDPMNVILNSFSKIDRNGEGAGIQVVFAPRGDYFLKNYKYAIEQIEKGVSVKEATYIPETLTGSFGKTLKSIFSSSTPKDPKENKKVDTEAIGKIKQKLESNIVATNIRLVASANSRLEAEKILHSIESSFNQFNDPNTNGLKPRRLSKVALQKMFRDYSFRRYDSQELLPLNLKEISTLMHFHNAGLKPSPQLKQSQAISAPPPSDMPDSGTFLGVNNYRNVDTPIYMQDADRLRHTYTIGQTGTGKTTLLVNMIIQDIQAGNGCCFIDPHGSDVQNILANIPKERFKDVIYFDPSYTERPMALNMLEYDRSKPEQKTFVVNELFSIFQKLYGGVPESLGPMFEQYFRNATMLVIEDPDSGSTLLDVSRVMTNKSFRDMKIANCKNPVVVQFWKEIAEKADGEARLANIVPYITSKFDVFLANDIMRPIVAQEKSSFDFRKIMDEKKILLVNLSKGRLGDINANLIGLILVGKILMAALSRVDMVGVKDFPPFYLYIDEFQNITTNSISAILSEARKYKLSLNIAHQFIAQLDEGIKNAVFGNVGSIMSFRVGAEDAEYLEKQFSPVFTAKDLMNIDNYNFYAKLLFNGKTTKAFNVKAVSAPLGKQTIADNLKQLSYLTYGGDRAEIETEILAKYKK